MSKLNIIPIFVPHLGCPLDCCFCNQKKITGVSTDISSDIVEKTILEYLSYFKRKDNVEVAFYGGSFTAIDKNIQSELLSVAFKYKKKGLVNNIRLSTRPDCIDTDTLDNLKKFGVDIIELGVQSLDDGVLILSNRGHDSKCVQKSSELIKDYGFKLGLQQMIGLPGDSFSKSYYTAKEFVKLNPHCVRIYPTLVVKDTALENDLYEGTYDALSLSDSISIVSDILNLYYKNNINVIRVGLQPTENINYNGDVVAGPFHPAYRQLVEGNYLYNCLKNYLLANDEKKDILIYANGRNISNIAGQKSKNKKKLIENLKLNELVLREKKLDNFTLEINDKNIDIRDYYKMENKCI